MSSIKPGTDSRKDYISLIVKYFRGRGSIVAFIFLFFFVHALPLRTLKESNLRMHPFSTVCIRRPYSDIGIDT